MLVRSQFLPKYRRHKQSGQAVVTLSDGLGGRKDRLLGPYGTAESKKLYNRLVAEWLANGRTYRKPEDVRSDLTLNELCLAFFRHAQDFYVKNGEQTSEVCLTKLAVRFLRQLYGDTPVSQFGPLRLAVVRDAMVCYRSRRIVRVVDPQSGNVSTVEKVGNGMTRKTINSQIERIRRMFVWGVEKELVDAGILAALKAVKGLRKGKTEARENPPVKPVPNVWMEKTLPYLPPLVADMVQVQRLTGMRPQEVCIIRPIDIDMTGDVWEYRPDRHKTEHHDRERIVPIGPRAQEIIKRNLPTATDAYIFSPKESEADRNAKRRAERKTPMTPSHSKRKRKHRPKRPPGGCYDTNSYRRAIARACKAADVPKWAPNQLRHAAATEIRKAYGLEAAQAVLGHGQLTVTQVYAETDREAARRVMRAIG